MHRSQLTRIVVVGGAGGGLELATKLGKRYRKRDDIEVTLVDRSHSHLWKPLLHEVAAGTLNSNEDELSYLAHAHWGGYQFRLGAFKDLDRHRKTITIAASSDAEGSEYIPERILPYDTLVIAIGSVTNDFAVDGITRHCSFLDARDEADVFHQHLVRTCYLANAQSEPVRPGQLHIAIAGAGATGVELAAELDYSITALVGFGLDKINIKRDLWIHLIEGSDRVLPELPERVSSATHALLDQLGITVHTGELVTEATAEGFHTRSGEFIAAEIKVWAAGIKAPSVCAGLVGLETNPLDQLVVRSSLQTTRDDDIFALSDCAACPMGKKGQLVPPRAQAAHQQASLAARSIERRLRGGNLPEYVYKDFGSLINLSEHSAIGNLMGNFLGSKPTNIPIEGRLARWAYLSLYKMHQIAIQGVIRTVLITIANFLTRTGKPRLKLH